MNGVNALTGHPRGSVRRRPSVNQEALPDTAPPQTRSWTPASSSVRGRHGFSPGAAGEGALSGSPDGKVTGDPGPGPRIHAGSVGGRDNPALATTILCWSVSSQVSEKQRPGVRVCECVCDAHTCTRRHISGAQHGGPGFTAALSPVALGSGSSVPSSAAFPFQLLCPQRGVDE